MCETTVTIYLALQQGCCLAFRVKRASVILLCLLKVDYLAIPVRQRVSKAI